MRTITKPSTAKCDLDKYTLFLLAEPKYSGCNRLSEILGDVSHDSVNRFLVRTTEAILTHFFCSIRAFTLLELMREQQVIESWYEPQRKLYIRVARDFILDNLSQKIKLKTSF